MMQSDGSGGESDGVRAGSNSSTNDQSRNTVLQRSVSYVWGARDRRLQGHGESCAKSSMPASSPPLMNAARRPLHRRPIRPSLTPSSSCAALSTRLLHVYDSR